MRRMRDLPHLDPPAFFELFAGFLPGLITLSMTSSSVSSLVNFHSAFALQLTIHSLSASPVPLFPAPPDNPFPPKPPLDFINCVKPLTAVFANFPTSPRLAAATAEEGDGRESVTDNRWRSAEDCEGWKTRRSLIWETFPAEDLKEELEEEGGRSGRKEEAKESGLGTKVKEGKAEDR